jgi:hypothetical protein
MRIVGREAGGFSLDSLVRSQTEGWFNVMDIAGIILGYVAVIGGLSIAPIAIIVGNRQQQRKRELEHIERMKALEYGRTLPQDEPWLSPMKIGALIGIVVPIGAFLLAGLTTARAGFHDGIWVATVLVGSAAVICGTILVMASFRSPAAPSEPAVVKPYVEEDAYDVVASRG